MPTLKDIGNGHQVACHLYDENKEYLTDFLSAGKYGVILSIAVSLLLLTGGFLFQGFSLPEAFQVWRSGMCILSGISLFLVAGSILTKKSSKIDKHSRWREKFKKLNYESVIGTIAVIFILFASCADAVTRVVS